MKLELSLSRKQDGCGVDVLNVDLEVTDSFAVNAINGAAVVSGGVYMTPPLLI